MKQVSLLLLLALMGCKSNPYDDNKVSVERPAVKPEVKPAFGIDIPMKMDFKEGMLSDYPVNVSVPSGTAQVTWSGLPAEATYDQVKKTLTWTPSYTDANDSTNPSVKNRFYVATIKLRSSEDANLGQDKTVTLMVQDTPRSFGLNFTSESFLSVKEGNAINPIKFDLISEDYPQGPFIVSLKNGFSGLKISPTIDPKQFSVTSPVLGFDTVKSGTSSCDSYSCEQVITDTIVVFTPDGRSAEGNIKVRIRDERSPVATSLADEIEVKGDTSIGFTAIDTNQETIPQIKLLSSPSVGIFELKQSTSKSASPFEANFQVSWSQIPQEAVGKTFSAKFEACSYGSSSKPSYNNCREIVLALVVASGQVILPEIFRGDWNKIDMKYVLPGRKLSHKIEVTPGAGVRLTTVTAVSSDPLDVVTYASKTISVDAQSTGIKFVTVTATNSIGGVSSETFMYEVLPLNWSSNLILGLLGDSVELSSLEGHLGNSNREFSAAHGLRTLFNRKKLIVGTNVLGLTGGTSEVEYYAANIKDVLISTPRLSDLPSSVIGELRSHGVHLGGRGSDLPGFDLAQYEITPARALGLPSGVSGLAGVTTHESSNPALLAMTNSSDCTRLFGLFKAGPVPSEVLIGVSCPRTKGGQLVVLGFEWADIRVSQPDSELPAQWFKRLME